MSDWRIKTYLNVFKIILLWRSCKYYFYKEIRKEGQRQMAYHVGYHSGVFLRNLINYYFIWQFTAVALMYKIFR
jgi:hypothetical protein